MFKIVYYTIELYFLLFIFRVYCENSNLKPVNYKHAIDISHHQGDINWVKVKNAGISYVIMKATEGKSFQDPNFLNNWNAANEQGLETSVYHYFRGSSSKPEEQVENIIRTLSSTDFNKNEHILVIDVEEQGNEKATPDEMANNLHKLLNDLEAHNFKHIFIYAGYYYWENKVSWKLYDFSKYPLWLAQWLKNPTDKIDGKRKLPTTWKNVGWTYWQYTSKGKVDGIETDVDLSYCKPYIH